MMIHYEKRRVEGTGAALNVLCGYVPTKVRITRDDLVGEMVWFDHMSDGTAIRSNYPVDSDGLLSQPALSMGTTKDRVATEAFDYVIANVAYSKSAVEDGTGPTDTTIPQDKWGLFGFEIGSNGTIDNNDAADNNDPGYETEADAIDALPSVSSDHIMIGYVTVMSTNASGFVGDTTDFDHEDVTANFYTTDLLGYLSSDGITPINTNPTGQGFTIGDDSVFNIDGEYMTVEIWR